MRDCTSAVITREIFVHEPLRQALSSDAFWMVLLGRTLIGLGGARGVSRRYIADTIPVRESIIYRSRVDGRIADGGLLGCDGHGQLLTIVSKIFLLTFTPPKELALRPQALKSQNSFLLPRPLGCICRYGYD